MTDVFVSYKREDLSRIEPIADGLRDAGLSVWIDLETPGGTSWRQTIDERLNDARCVIVVWSTASVAPAATFVHDEAARSLQRGVMLPVRLDDVPPPLGFGEIQTLDLTGWRGNVREARFRDLVAAAQAMVAGEPRPPLQAPKQRRRTVALSGVVSILAVLLGFLGDVAGLQGAVCRTPGIRALCAATGLGHVPSEAEEALWASRQDGDCEVLREYLVQYPGGAFAEEARSRLGAVRRKTEESWTPTEIPLPLMVRRLDPQKDEEAAREDALARGHEEAERACVSFNVGEYRFLSAVPDVQKWTCGPRGDGIACGFDGSAICRVEKRLVEEVEICP